MRYIHINIVGMFSNKEEVNEIENVARVFFVEERVIDLTSGIVSRNNNGKKYLEQSIRKNEIQKISHKSYQIFTVKGLN